MEAKEDVLMVDTNGNFWGIADYSRLEKQPRHKRLFAMISKRYKRRFMNLKGFEYNGK